MCFDICTINIRVDFEAAKCQTWRKSRTKCSFWCSHVSRLASLVCPWLRRVYGGSCKTCPFVSCVICSSRMACMSWKALLAARHCVATPVLLSRRENRIGAMTLFHCSTIGLSINIFTSCHNRYFNIVIFHIRVSIRVRGLHLVFLANCHWHPLWRTWQQDAQKLRTRMRSGNAMASALARIRRGVELSEWTDARSTRRTDGGGWKFWWLGKGDSTSHLKIETYIPYIMEMVF